MKSFISNVRDKQLFTIKNRLLLAVSGGVDSVVLSHLCYEAGFDFGMAHCNFQLRGNDSLKDEQFVKEFAATLNKSFHTTQFETQSFARANQYSIQEAARVLRYDWLEKIRTSGHYDFIVTAHHADDNIETVLMNFFRGSGIRGLTGIREKNGKIRRPLLFARRADMETYLNQHRLQFTQDASNDSDKYTRNNFRNTILPLIRKEYAEADQIILDNVERLKDVEILYREALEKKMAQLVKKNGDDIFISALLLRKTPAAKTILFELLKDCSFKPAQIQEVLNLTESESGKYVISSTHRVLKDRRHLIISPLNKVDENYIIADKPGDYSLSNNILRFTYSDTIVISKDPQFAFIDAAKVAFPFVLRKWKIGDYFYPLGMAKKKKLSRFFIDAKLSLTEKEKIWVLEMNKKIVWIVGHRIDDRFKVTENTRSVLKIEWLR